MSNKAKGEESNTKLKYSGYLKIMTLLLWICFMHFDYSTKFLLSIHLEDY